jgi:Transcriptional Coactivator p15 (PC4)
MEDIVHGISNRRELETDEKYVILRDTKSDKMVKIPSHIWIMLSRKFPKIEKALENKKNCFVHLDDGWCVSVRKPFACVNIRRYYFASNGGLNPSRQGMSFKPSEWAALTSVSDSLH